VIIFSGTNNKSCLRLSITIAFNLGLLGCFVNSGVQAAELLVEVSRIRQLEPVIYLRIDSVHREDLETNNVPVEALLKFKATPTGKSETFHVGNLNPGLYMARLFQDVNNNGVLDMDDKGRPMEHYGLSNNPILLKEPVLKDAAFELTDDKTVIKIRLRNKRGNKD